MNTRRKVIWPDHDLPSAGARSARVVGKPSILATPNPALSPDDQVIRRAIRILESRWKKAAAVFTDSSEAKAFFRLRLAQLEHEVFEVAFLNNANELIAVETMFRGSIVGTSVHPREVAKRALHFNAAAVVLAHNHPSGRCTASATDVALTRSLTKALELIEVRVIDHVIVTLRAATSLSEMGRL